MFCCVKHYATFPQRPTSHRQMSAADISVSFFMNMWNSLKVLQVQSLLVCLGFRWKIPTRKTRRRGKDAHLMCGANCDWCVSLWMVWFCDLDSSLHCLYRWWGRLHHLDLTGGSVSASTQQVCVASTLFFLLDEQNKQFPAFLVLILLGFLAPVFYQWKHKLFPGPYCSGQVLSNITAFKVSVLLWAIASYMRTESSGKVLVISWRVYTVIWGFSLCSFHLFQVGLFEKTCFSMWSCLLSLPDHSQRS